MFEEVNNEDQGGGDRDGDWNVYSDLHSPHNHDDQHGQGEEEQVEINGLRQEAPLSGERLFTPEWMALFMRRLTDHDIELGF